MADVRECLEKISEAIYGRDVRSAIHDSIEAMNDQVESYASGEEARVESEKQRSDAESSRASAEEQRESAEEQRASAEKARESAEAAREQRIDGIVDATGAERVHLCTEAECAAAEEGSDCRVPSIASPKQQVLYLTPRTEHAEHADYCAWLYVNGKWEMLGGGNGTGDPVAIERGGTGATDAETARANLSVYSKEEVDGLIAKAPSGSTGGTVTVTGTSFSNQVFATISSIDKGTIISRVKLKLTDGSTATAFESTANLTAMKAAAGALVGMVFAEHDVHVVKPIANLEGTDVNYWTAEVEDCSSDEMETRLELSAKGATIYAVIPTSVQGVLGLGETSSTTVSISPFDIHLLAVSRTHNGGGN